MLEPDTKHKQRSGTSVWVLKDAVWMRQDSIFRSQLECHIVTVTDSIIIWETLKEMWKKYMTLFN